MSTVAVVTGAGAGLGKRIAERLAKRHHVVVTDLDLAAARTTAAAIGGTAEAQDVRDPEGHRAIAQRASERGRVCVWVNNAGILHTGESWKITDAIVRRMVEVNLLGVMWGTSAAIGVMGDGGHIVNIASFSSLGPTPGLAAYGATKHGVLGYSLSVAGEMRRANLPIKISALCPDAFAGDMTDRVAHDDAASLLFVAGQMLSLDAVVDAAIDLVDHPRLVKTLPAYRAALLQLVRPFPSLALSILGQVAKLDRRRRRSG